MTREGTKRGTPSDNSVLPIGQMPVRGSYGCDRCGKRLSPDDAVLSLLAVLCPRCDKLGDKRYPDLEPEWASWFAGLADGEGCFYISPSVGCSFIINLRADDTEVIKDIERRLGMGRIGRTKRNVATRRMNPLVTFTVARKEDLVQLIAIFDAYPLRTKKGRDYAIWRKAALAHYDGAKASSLGVYKTELAEIRKYREPS